MTYVVSVFETWYWQSVLATKDMADAPAVKSCVCGKPSDQLENVSPPWGDGAPTEFCEPTITLR